MSLPDDKQGLLSKVLRMLAAKWNVQVLLALADRPYRFNSLKRHLPGVSHRVLTTTLRQLEDSGLVGRRVRDSKPLAVEYRITDWGERVVGLIRLVQAWIWCVADRPGGLSRLEALGSRGCRLPAPLASLGEDNPGEGEHVRGG